MDQTCWSSTSIVGIRPEGVSKWKLNTTVMKLIPYHLAFQVLTQEFQESMFRKECLKKK